ncbi:hypothetical protein CSV79_11740 [Sporosarcina sp. P13]|uniref:type II toxin-antitoxin system toxin DNA ADP-ribosyl transferase DarT n=1 Tax=Sporosarcina sp. P13 TaxID=2048263 RepID=UPI000C16E05B|nr:DUF4433 domain-containing protein [Sporosarcina sp. P13]PIC63460.1 hypothetical protein CSV79_11740 [Sporosarcina sp. P13]
MLNKLLYHMTHINNIPSIVKSNGLYSHSLIHKKSVSYQDVANIDIQDKRGQKIVPISPGGNLHDYVPFYFAPRSPMLYAIVNGGISQEEIVYFMTNTQNVHRDENNYVFTDSHAIMRLTNFYSNLQDLDQIDWDIMQSKYWHDHIDYPNRKMKRQAEFLIYNQLSMSSCIGFAVYNKEAELKLRKILNDLDQDIFIGIRPDYFF